MKISATEKNVKARQHSDALFYTPLSLGMFYSRGALPISKGNMVMKAYQSLVKKIELAVIEERKANLKTSDFGAKIINLLKFARIYCRGTFQRLKIDGITLTTISLLFP